MRTAIILSLGMLNQSVTTDAFIGKMLKLAKEKDPAFQFTNELKIECFGISERFNRNQITPDMFMAEILARLKIEISASEFWNSWNGIVMVGEQIKQTINDLKSFSDTHSSLMYLNTDTNLPHLEILRAEYTKRGIKFDTECKPAVVNDMPLYISCAYGVNRIGLVQNMIADIKSKIFNKPDQIIIVAGDPENIKNEENKGIEKARIAQLKTWCQTNGVQLVLHNNTQPLLQTLDQAVQQNHDENVVTHTLTMA